MKLTNVGTSSDFILYLSGGRINIRAVTEKARVQRKSIAFELREQGLFTIEVDDDRTIVVWSEIDKLYPDLAVAVKAGLESEGFTTVIPEDQQEYWSQPIIPSR